MAERPALVIDRVIAEMKRVDWDRYTSTRPGLMAYVTQAKAAIKALRVDIADQETYEELGPDLQEPESVAHVDANTRV